MHLGFALLYGMDHAQMFIACLLADSPFEQSIRNATLFFRVLLTFQGDCAIEKRLIKRGRLDL